MLKNTVISVLIVAFIMLSNSSFAQHQHNKQHKGHAKQGNAKVKKGNHQPHRYARNKVVVVKHRKVRTVKTLPTGYKTIVHNKVNYHQHNGTFYRTINGAYTVAFPPRGLRIKLLPKGHKKFLIAGINHFYYKGIYYKQVDNNYEVIEPPVGTVVSELPQDDIEVVTIDGQQLFEINGTLYKTIGTPENLNYEVVGNIES
jgi:hypothetical protein